MHATPPLLPHKASREGQAKLYAATFFLPPCCLSCRSCSPANYFVMNFDIAAQRSSGQINCSFFPLIFFLCPCHNCKTNKNSVEKKKKNTGRCAPISAPLTAAPTTPLPNLLGHRNCELKCALVLRLMLLMALKSNSLCCPPFSYVPALDLPRYVCTQLN